MANRTPITVVMTALLAVGVGVAAAREATPPRLVEHEVRSRVLGEEVAVSVYLPAGYDAPGARFPCLYLLEPDLYHRALTGIVDTRTRLGSIPGLIVVGVATNDRWRDLTPTVAGVPGGEVIPSSGGAGRYRAFLTDELIPRIESEHRTQPFRILCAHSLAGLFALETVLRAPDMFGGVIVTSPSLWWDEETTAGLAEHRLRPDAAQRTRLFVATGNEDGTIQGPVDRLCAVLERQAPGGFEWRRVRHGESSHQELPIRAFNDGLDFIFSGWELQADAMERGIEAVDAHYAALSERFGYEIEVPEKVVNRIGYRALSDGRTNLAVALFRRNVQAHPGSANAHDSLGEALLVLGDADGARASYERALALDPDSPSARAALERLGGPPER